MDIRLFFKEYEQLLDVAQEYGLHGEQLFIEISQQVSYERYCQGGELLHRGYYCPSIIADLVTGNVTRGRLLKNRPTSKEPTFIYGFDHKDRLVTVKSDTRREVLFHKDDAEIGLILYGDMKISAISKCCYEGNRIKSYLFCLYNPYEEDIVEINEEHYVYFEDKLQVDWYRSGGINHSILQHTRYNFLVHNGYLQSYIIEEFNGEEKISSVWDNHTFNVRKKRSISV